MARTLLTLLLVTWAVLCEAAPPGYIDGAVCATCHGRIAEAYAKTGMGRSFRAVAKDTRLPEFERGGFDHELSGDRFTPLRRDGRYYVRREQTQVFDESVDYVIGSGDHAVGYLHRTADNKLVEFPLSWYSERGGHWGMSPGYDRADHPGFSRAISFRCMFCHNGYPQLPSGAPDWSGATVFPARLPEGIDCQRCHGPGAAHIEAVRQGQADTVIRAAIVNPARLAPDRRMEVCMQCHLETAGMQTPGERGVFSWVPGEKLSDYLLYFNREGERFGLVSSVYRLRKAECFRKSGGALTCITCHDPHEALSREEALVRTNKVCSGCHAGAIARLVSAGKHADRGDCATCHMARRQGVDAVHITITDHLIAKPAAVPAAAPLVEEHDGNTLPYAGEVVSYYPVGGDLLNLAIAQVKDLANFPLGLVQLEKLLADTRPRGGAPWFELGDAYFRTAQAARALPFYREAVRREPDNWRYLHGLGQALEGSGVAAEAALDFEKAVALAPHETDLLESLGAAYVALGRLTDGVRTFREAVQRNPEDATARNNLGRALSLEGDAAGAESEFREAVRLRPEMGALRMGYAAQLLRNGRLPEAQVELEQAIRTGASSVIARTAWFARLAATGDVVEARRSYDDSMRTQLSGAHNNLGNVLLARGDTDGAIREYRLAMTADAQSALAQLNLGQTLLEHGHAEEGRAHLNLAAQSTDLKIRGAAGELLRRK